MPITRLKVHGKGYDVFRSDRKDKKFKVNSSGRDIHFGARGYSISPGTDKGDRYCARSSGIKNKKGLDANELSRAMWGCKGKKSYRRTK